jgi:hypothetical protein
MHHHAVHRRAERSGITLIAQTRRTTSVVADKLIRYLVQLGGSNTRPDRLSHFGISLTQQDIASSHELYFFVSLEIDHLLN